MTNTLFNQDGKKFFSTKDENGETIYSFSESFEDFWTESDQELYG